MNSPISGERAREQPDCRPLPRSVQILWAVEMMLSGICIAVMAVARYVFHRGYPYGSPFEPSVLNNDFWIYVDRCKAIHSQAFFRPEAGWIFTYPAPMALIYKAFYMGGRHSDLLFWAVTGAMTAGLFLCLGWRLFGLGARRLDTTIFIVSSLLASYPLWFVYRLGNMEICVFLVVSLALLAFVRGRSYTAAILIGIAASLKIFPAVYLALLLSRRQYRQFAVGIVTAAIVNLVSLWVVCPDIGYSYRGIAKGLDTFRVLYMLQYRKADLSFDHSLLGSIKCLLHLCGTDRISESALNLYLLATAVSGLALYFIVVRKLPILNQFVCLCVLSILLPPVSIDYTLLNLYVPCGLLVLYAVQVQRTGRMSHGLTAAFVCFGVLFAFVGEFVYAGAGIAGQIKAVALVALLVIALRFRWEPIVPAAAAA